MPHNLKSATPRWILSSSFPTTLLFFPLFVPSAVYPLFTFQPLSNDCRCTKFRVPLNRTIILNLGILAHSPPHSERSTPKWNEIQQTRHTGPSDASHFQALTNYLTDRLADKCRLLSDVCNNIPCTYMQQSVSMYIQVHQCLQNGGPPRTGSRASMESNWKFFSLFPSSYFALVVVSTNRLIISTTLLPILIASTDWWWSSVIYMVVSESVQRSTPVYNFTKILTTYHASLRVKTGRKLSWRQTAGRWASE